MARATNTVKLLSVVFLFSTAVFFWNYNAFTPLFIIISSALMLISILVIFLDDPYLILFTDLAVYSFATIVDTAVQLPTDADGIIEFAVRQMVFHHLDPYLPSTTADYLKYVHVPAYYLTQLLSGGYVTRLIYPGMSIILNLPTAFVNITLYNALLNIATLVIASLVLAKRGQIDTAVFFILASGVLGVPPLFMVLAILFEEYYGVFYGLAISVNQLPVVLFPFALLYLKDKKRFIWQTFASFLITNIPFILWNPKAWFEAMLFSAHQPVTPIGFSISRLSWLGYTSLNSYGYLVLFASVLVVLIVLLSVIDRKELYILFPAVAFLFFPRTLLGYITMWIVLMTLYYHRLAPVHITRPKLVALSTAVLMGISIASVLTVSTFYNPPAPYVVKVDHVYIQNSTIVAITVTVRSNITANVTFDILPVQLNANTWASYGTYLVRPGVQTFNITPANPVFDVPAGLRFEIVAFYNNYAYYIYYIY